MRNLMRSAALAAVLCLTIAAPALAHEHRGVGDHEFVVGWLIEPTYAGYVNGVQVEVSHKGGGPITGAKLKVVVIFGGRNGTTKSDALALNPSDETPGQYTADIIPTRPGQYTFHVTGSLGAGESIDQFFTSSETTFDEVKEPSVAQFPSKDPSTSQLASRLTKAEKDANAARQRAMVAAAIGLVAMLFALASLVRRRR